MGLLSRMHIVWLVMFGGGARLLSMAGMFVCLFVCCGIERGIGNITWGGMGMELEGLGIGWLFFCMVLMEYFPLWRWYLVFFFVCCYMLPIAYHLPVD